MKWITATEIENWTNQEPRKAQELLPELIWRLLLASCRSIIDHHFPFGKAVQFNGYDGGLETDDASPHFPKGKSVWEIGTDSDILKKFNEDYDKRSKDPKGICQADTTFCFVTSRIWNHRKGITEVTEEKNAQEIWKKVRIIDANNLEIWLENCPSVCSWFSTIIGKPNKEMQALSELWEDTINVTAPNLNSDFFLFNRKPILNEVLSIIDGSASQIIISADSWLEAILCVAAEVASSDDLSVAAFGERCIIAHSLNALNEIDAQKTNTIIIPAFHLSDSPVTIRKNTLLLPVSRFDPLDRISKEKQRVEIPPRTRHDFCAALEKLGYNANDAFTIGQDLRCNFQALYRMLHLDPTKKVPEWSRNEDIDVLIPALFAGAWEERSPGDKQILSLIAGMPYENYISSIKKYTAGENNPIFCVDGSYACISIQELWDVLWPRITKTIYSNFLNGFQQVFSENDPTYELPEEKWFMAGVLGKAPSYSSQLKESMIISFIMLTERDSFPETAQFSTNVIGECSSCVKRAFEPVDTLNHWRTISPFLPSLLEAAPDAVLSVLKSETQKPNSPVWDLFTFRCKGDLLFGKSFYPYILWALEKAVWDKRYATMALDILISYSEKGYTYQLSNCPETSLFHIFCLWFPQGVFTHDERKILLERIIKDHHSIAPELVRKLLASGQQVSTGISKPKWRAIEEERCTVTYFEINDLRKHISTTYLESITPSYRDWKVPFMVLSSFESISSVTEKCSSQVDLFSEDDKLALCKDLSQYISRSRKFGQGNPEIIDEIEKLYNDFLPKSPKSYAHLFAYHFFGLNPMQYESDSYNYIEERTRLFEFQREKIRCMIETYGKESVIDILPYVEDKNAYANAITEEVLHGEPDWQFIFSIKVSSSETASSIVEYLYNKNKLNMFSSREGITSDSDFGWLLSRLPINDEVYDYVEKLENDELHQAYWENVNVFFIDRHNTLLIEKCINCLLKHKRPYSIMKPLAYSEWNEPNQIAEVLTAALLQYPEPEPSGLLLTQISGDCIEKLFEKMYCKNEVSEISIARLELAYLKTFNVDFEPKCLMNQVLKTPELYIELLTSGYRSDNGDTKDQAPSNKYAELAFSALDRIHRVPGFNIDDDSLDEDVFNRWITETNQLANNCNYTTAHNVVLGKILSYSPVGNDGLWPAECVRQLFEKPHSDSLETEFIIGRENQRGVHTVSAGEEERRIAEEYREIADGLQLLYPQTASIVRRLSDSYQIEARAERARELKAFY